MGNHDSKSAGEVRERIVVIKKIFLLLFLSSLILAADFLSKVFVSLTLPLMAGPYPYGGIPVFESFGGISFAIVHTVNKGAAWGLFASHQGWLLLSRIILITSLLCYLLLFNKVRARQVPLILILTGAVGNVADTFIFGFVIDLFAFNFWGYSYPVFNIADSAIFTGIALLLLQSLFTRRPSEIRE